MFYMVVRIFFDTTRHHSVEYFMGENYSSEDEIYRAASGRLYNIVAADLANPNVVFQMAYAIDNLGRLIIDPIIYDRRTT